MDNQRHRVCIIGCGFFGAAVARAVSRSRFRKYQITIYDANDDILSSASMVNQCRVHYGYHYPRSDDTVREVKCSLNSFCDVFRSCIRKSHLEDEASDFRHYYCIVRDGSKVTAKEFEDFMRRHDLMFKEEWSPLFSREQLEGCYLTSEPTFNYKEAQRIVKNFLNDSERVSLKLSCRVVSLQKTQDGVFLVTLENGEVEEYDAVINSTYSNVNSLNEMLGVPLRHYQFELVEEFVIEPFTEEPIGFGLFDGPFWGIEPFGDGNEYVTADVSFGRLAQVVGPSPNFALTEDEARKTAPQRFEAWLAHARNLMPNLPNLKLKYPIYAKRILLPKSNLDSRPTVLENPIPGYWYIFSGKIVSSVQTGDRIATLIEKYFGALPYEAVVVGCGRIGRYHVEWMKKLGVKVSAVSVRSAESEDRVRKNLGTSLAVETDWANMIEKRLTSLDFVSICSSSEHHLEALRFCLHRREIRVILCEKPIVAEFQISSLKNLIHEAYDDKMLRGRFVFVNFQLTILCADLQRLSNEFDLKSFKFRWTPRPENVLQHSPDFWWETLSPHGLSVLYRLISSEHDHDFVIEDQAIHEDNMGGVVADFRVQDIKCEIHVGPSGSEEIERYFVLNDVRINYEVVLDGTEPKTRLSTESGKKQVVVSDAMGSYLKEAISYLHGKTSSVALMDLKDSLRVMDAQYALGVSERLKQKSFKR